MNIQYVRFKKRQRHCFLMVENQKEYLILNLQHRVFLPNTKYFGYKIGINIENTGLLVERNN